MKHKTQLITDNNGNELHISYDYEEEKGYYAEPGNPSTWVYPTVEIDVTKIEIFIFDKLIDILPLLTNKQIEKSKKYLKYE